MARDSSAGAVDWNGIAPGLASSAAGRADPLSWRATLIVLASVGVEPAKPYPGLIVDHAKPREWALGAYAKIRKG